MDYNNLMDWAFKGLVTVLFTIGGWLWIMLIKAVQKNQTELVKHKEDLAEHKLNISENYAKKIDLTTSVSQFNETAKRIHDRIDNVFTLLQNRIN